jgi:hypothetical protein
MLFIPLFVALCVKLDPGTHKGMHSVWPKNWVRYLPRCWGQKAMGKRNLRPMLSSLWAEREREGVVLVLHVSDSRPTACWSRGN